MSKTIDSPVKTHEIFVADYESEPEVYLCSQVKLDIVLCNQW